MLEQMPSQPVPPREKAQSPLEKLASIRANVKLSRMLSELGDVGKMHELLNKTLSIVEKKLVSTDPKAQEWAKFMERGIEERMRGIMAEKDPNNVKAKADDLYEYVQVTQEHMERRQAERRAEAKRQLEAEEAAAKKKVREETDDYLYGHLYR